MNRDHGQPRAMSGSSPGGPQHLDGGRRMVRLDASESLTLLGGVAVGRIVFTQAALPAIRPVNHLVDAGRIIIRTRLTAGIGVSAPTVVAYQADQLDPDSRTGWSVVATGYAQPLTDLAEAARLAAALTPWVDLPMDTVVAIYPEIITGYRLIAA